MEKDVSPSHSKQNASMLSLHSSPMESESVILSPLPAETNAGRSSTENDYKVNLQNLTSLIHSLFSEEEIKTLHSPSPSASPSCSTTSATATAMDNNTMAAENRLYQARLIIESHLYQELLNRYGLALNRLHDLSRLATALREENELLRLENDDLTRRFSGLLSQTQASLLNNRVVPSSSALSLVDDLQKMGFERENNVLHENTSEDVFSHVNSPTSVIGSDCLERRGTFGRTFLPKSISIRSSGHLKMNQRTAAGSINAGPSHASTRSRTPQSQIADAAKVYVKEEESAVEWEVCNQGMYKTELCNKWQETGACPYGPQCQFAHGLSELRPVLRHPRYKTEVCRMVLNGISCPYGHRCHFRHSLSDRERLMSRPR